MDTFCTEGTVVNYMPECTYCVINAMVHLMQRSVGVSILQELVLRDCYNVFAITLPWLPWLKYCKW